MYISIILPFGVIFEPQVDAILRFHVITTHRHQVTRDPTHQGVLDSLRRGIVEYKDVVEYEGNDNVHHNGADGKQGPVNLKFLHNAPFFQNGAKSGFEMCFGPSTLGAGAKTRLESRIMKVTPHCVCRSGNDGLDQASTRWTCVSCLDVVQSIKVPTLLIVSLNLCGAQVDGSMEKGTCSDHDEAGDCTPPLQRAIHPLLPHRLVHCGVSFTHCSSMNKSGIVRNLRKLMHLRGV